MLFPTPAKYRNRRRRINPNAAPPALVLVAVVYTDAPAQLELTFDRPIDVTLFDGSAVAVADGPYGVRWLAIGPWTMLSQTTIAVELSDEGSAAGDAVTLTAPATTRITAAADGGTWPGVTDLNLPFP